jgi:membrane associated rhomboid family serine protease
MRIKYNAPTTITFALVCALVLLVSGLFTGGRLVSEWFSVPGRGGFDAGSILAYPRLLTHVIGHADWAHLFGNLALLLLLGPILEQSYGSLTLLAMMAVTALVTGVLNVLLFPTGLMGASGIVFMMILLASFTNFGKGEIPLTFILIMLLYLGQEVWQMIAERDKVSQFAHIIGGFCGSLFGFFKPSKR